MAAMQCFQCGSQDHYLRSCPCLDDAQKEVNKPALFAKNSTIEKTPCWNCGELGHFKSQRLNPSIKRRIREENALCDTDPLLERPFRRLDVTYILRQKNPMEAYCQLLLSSFDGRGIEHAVEWKGKIWETDLMNHKASPQPDKNWNRGSKSLFIVSWTEPHILNTN
jgi:hypothetical protein